MLAILSTGKLDHVEENIARWQWWSSAETLNQSMITGHHYSDVMHANTDSEEFT